MIADFHFLRPAWFLALLPLAALVWWAVRARGRGGAWARVCDPALLPFVVEKLDGRLHARAAWAPGLAGALAIVAAAGPTWERLPVPVFRGDAALVIALDLSASMDAEDVKPSRLARARFKVADILALRHTGQTALLVFAGQSFVVTPLTTDTATITSQLGALEASIMPLQGSNPAAALELAGKLLAQAGMPRGHVLLVTDGGDDEALARARDVAAGADFTLSVLGVGSADGAPIPDRDGGFIKDDSGALVLAGLDGAALAALARAGHGDYLEAGVDDADVRSLSRRLDADRAAHVRELDELSSSQWHEVGPWLLLPLLPLAALAFRRGVLSVLLAAALAALVPPAARAEVWRTPDQAGQAAFDSGDYRGAAQRFEDPGWRAAARYRAGDFAGAAKALEGQARADDFYNRGNALARAGQLEEAIAAYDQALQRAPAHADARYNREQVAKRLAERQQDQQGGQQQQESPGEKRKQSQSERGEQQFGGDKGGSSDQDTSGATNAGGGAESKQRQHSEDEAGDSARSRGKARERLGESRAGDEDEAGNASQAKGTESPDESSAERAQATEQWLQQIPDDPAGLLRRKFEYQYKQLYGDAPRGSPPW